MILTCLFYSISAGQDTAKQALQEIVILPAMRPEVHILKFLSKYCRPAFRDPVQKGRIKTNISLYQV